MTHQRTIKYVNERRKILYNPYDEIGLSINGLKSPKIVDMKSKLAGYKPNAFQFWEINNLHDMQIVKAIVDRRISKKNFSTAKFIDYATEYDKFFIKQKAQWYSDNGDAPFNFMALFTLEWKYSFEFYYAIASEMILNNVTTIPDIKRRLSAFSASISITSRLLEKHPHIVGGIIYKDSRMLVQRKKYIQDIITAPKEQFEDELNRFIEAQVVVASLLTHMTYKNENIRSWFIANTDENDWLSVFRKYDVFQAFTSNKDWTDKRKIRYIKGFYSKMGFSYKNPEFRS